MPYDVHMVGSVPLRDAEEVMTTLSKALGPHLPRIPDGETGRPWSSWMESVFAEHPDFVKKAENVVLAEKPGSLALAKYGLRPGVSALNVGFDRLPVGDVAIESFRLFKGLKKKGIVRSDARYQVTIAPAHVAVWRWVEDSLHPVLEPAYDRALVAQIDRMLSVIPREELAIQWDIASRVFARLEWGKPSRYGTTKTEMAETFAANLADLGNAVPAGVELLYHFCYGDTGHRHTVEPSTMADMVDMANRISTLIPRSIELIHMPVPRSRDDNEYFAPLQNLQLHPETRISLGLIHYTDGVQGTRKRMSVAHRYLANYSVATECGLGRRHPETIQPLIKMHADLAEVQVPG